jgi:hypothetical protein
MDKYRVIIMREGVEADETLFEIAGSAGLVQQIVPAVLDTVLAEGWAATAAAGRSLADRVFDSVIAADAAAEAEQDAADEAAGKPKRTRRTKAQIAADKEAQAAGFRDAAHRAEVESTVAAAPPEAVIAGGPAAAAAYAPSAIVTEAPAASGGDAAPWNPFAS